MLKVKQADGTFFYEYLLLDKIAYEELTERFLAKEKILVLSKGFAKQATIELDS